MFERRGLRTVKNARATKVERAGDRGVVHLEDGRTVEGSHVLLTIGQVPQTNGLGLEELGIQTDERGALVVDGVSRTSVPSIYAAGDVTAKLMLASVAAMQGRIAMWHLLGQAVSPLRWDAVVATIFTDPQIATVGLSEQRAAETGIEVEVDTLPLAGNSRAKMSNRPDGFRQAAGPARLGDDRRRGGGRQLRLGPGRPHLRGLLQPPHGQPAIPGVPTTRRSPARSRCAAGSPCGSGFPVLGRRTGPQVLVEAGTAIAQ